MKKIMFNDKYGLTQAVLNGRKTITRRIAIPATEKEITLCNINKDWYEDEESNVYIPKYQVGEVVAIAQSYMDVDRFHRKGKNAAYLDYLDSMLPDMKKVPGWHNKMFVEASLMPHHIRITDIKIERLQDISEEDCEKEGIQYLGLEYEHYGDPMYSFEGSDTYYTCAKDAFSRLIDKISGKGTWERNPFVFAYSFKRIDNVKQEIKQ